MNQSLLRSCHARPPGMLRGVGWMGPVNLHRRRDSNSRRDTVGPWCCGRPTQRRIAGLDGGDRESSDRLLDRPGNRRDLSGRTTRALSPPCASTQSTTPSPQTSGGWRPASASPRQSRAAPCSISRLRGRITLVEWLAEDQVRSRQRRPVRREKRRTSKCASVKPGYAEQMAEMRSYRRFFQTARLDQLWPRYLTPRNP